MRARGLSEGRVFSYACRMTALLTFLQKAYASARTLSRMEAEKVMASINQGGYERSRTRRQYRQSTRATMADEGVAEVYHADKGQEEAIRFRERTACRRAGKSYIAR